MLHNAVEGAFHVKQGSTTGSRVDQSEPRWSAVDRALRAIASRRAALDADEARWLREAEALQIWRPLGMVSALDYLERVCGYAPRTAQDRLRVARALGSLPQLTAVLARGELPFSAVRELTRVATPATEASWIAAATSKNLRQIEDLVADHNPGDGPDDPKDPKARTHVVRFELSAETFALLRQARTILDNEHHTNLADDTFVGALCSAVLDGNPTSESTGRARFQIAMTVCERCRQGWQEGAGARIPVGAAAVERAMCDAQHIGSIDGPEPERAYQDIPPSVARFVWRRDGGRCRVAGCRSARGLELHHIIHRADGGSHDALNIILCCSACHQSHHAGLLTISGTAEHLEVRRPGEPVVPDVGERVTQINSSADDQGAHGVRSSSMTGAALDQESSPRSVAVTSARADVSDDSISVAPSFVVDTRVHVGVDSPAAGVGGDASDDIAGADGDANDSAPDAARETAGAGVGIASRLGATILCTQAKAALTGLGWKPAIAQAAVAAAAAARGAGVTLEQLIIESLRRCPVPRA
jgi:hypothetical protein